MIPFKVLVLALEEGEGSAEKASRVLKGQGHTITREGIYARLQREGRMDLLSRRLCTKTDDEIEAMLRANGGHVQQLAAEIHAGAKRIVLLAIERQIPLARSPRHVEPTIEPPWRQLLPEELDEIRTLRAMDWRALRIARSLGLCIDQVRSVR